MSREGRGRPPSRATRGRGGGGGTTGEPLAPRGPSDPELERHGRAPTPPPGGCERKEKKKSQHVVVVDVVVVRPRPQRESGGWSFVRSFRSARPGPSDGSIGLEIVRLPQPPPLPRSHLSRAPARCPDQLRHVGSARFLFVLPPLPSQPRPLSRSFPGARFQRTFPARNEAKPAPWAGAGGSSWLSGVFKLAATELGTDGRADHEHRPAEAARSY